MTRPSAQIVVILAIVTVGFVTMASDPGEYVGDDTCEACHEEVVAAFARTAHAVAPGWDAENGCESCHGPGAAHIEDGDPSTLMLPQQMTAREGSKVCLDCHTQQSGQASLKRSIHHRRDVGCVSCHNGHSTAESLLIKTSPELCADCHQGIDAQFELARSHPIEDCSDCHSPHATRALRTDSAALTQTCKDCHFEKAGPFIYEHDVALVDGCNSCHSVHGGPNRHLLKHEVQVNLCYQCHSANVTPNFHSANRFLNEKCTACHTAIHGSNTNPFFLEE